VRRPGRNQHCMTASTKVPVLYAPAATHTGLTSARSSRATAPSDASRGAGHRPPIGIYNANSAGESPMNRRPPPRRLRGWPGLGGRRQRRRQLPCPGLPHTTASRPLRGADSGRGQERAGVRLDRSASVPGLGPGKAAGGPCHDTRLRLRQLVLGLEVEPRRMSASMSVMDSTLIS
jgi:hypothetical protein